MGVSAAVTMDTGMFIFCACAEAHITAVYQLSGWIKAWFILYSIIRLSALSGMAQEQRCPDNRGSTVYSYSKACTYMYPRNNLVHCNLYSCDKLSINMHICIILCMCVVNKYIVATNYFPFTDREKLFYKTMCSKL